MHMQMQMHTCMHACISPHLLEVLDEQRRVARAQCVVGRGIAPSDGVVAPSTHGMAHMGMGMDMAMGMDMDMDMDMDMA